MADTTTEFRIKAEDRDLPAKRSWEQPIVRKASIASMTQTGKTGIPTDTAGHSS